MARTNERTERNTEQNHGKKPVRKGFRLTRTAQARVGPEPAADGPAPDPRGHLAASVRDAARAWADRAASRTHVRDLRSHHPDQEPAAPVPGRPRGTDAGRAREELRAEPHPLSIAAQGRAGHRARDRPGARIDTAGHDDLLR